MEACAARHAVRYFLHAVAVASSCDSLTARRCVRLAVLPRFFFAASPPPRVALLSSAAVGACLSNLPWLCAAEQRVEWARIAAFATEQAAFLNFGMCMTFSTCTPLVFYPVRVVPDQIKSSSYLAQALASAVVSGRTCVPLARWLLMGVLRSAAAYCGVVPGSRAQSPRTLPRRWKR